MLIGPTVDFRTCEEHYGAFSADAGAAPGLLELHVPLRDLDEQFERRLESFAAFAIERGLRTVSFHCPDALQNRMLLGRLAGTDAVVDALAGGLAVDPAGARRDVDRLLAAAGRVASTAGCDVLVVVHQGVYLPAGGVAALEAERGGDAVVALRRTLLGATDADYDWMVTRADAAGVTLGLETSPPGSANGRHVHVIDTCFEDVAPRLARGGRFVFDTSHVAMCCAYFQQSGVRLPIMEATRACYGGVPPSLGSPASFLRAAAPATAWFHLSDANGFAGPSEGLPLGTAGALVDWPGFLALADSLVDRPRGVLELVDSHADYSLMRRSLAWLRDRQLPRGEVSHVSI